jgi:hypothetical protein
LLSLKGPRTHATLNNIKTIVLLSHLSSLTKKYCSLLPRRTNNASLLLISGYKIFRISVHITVRIKTPPCYLQMDCKNEISLNIICLFYLDKSHAYVIIFFSSLCITSAYDLKMAKHGRNM